MRQGHLPGWMIERLAFEPEAASPASAGHLDACGECRAAADALRGERGAFLSARPAGPFVSRVMARAQESAAARLLGWIRSRRVLAAGLAAAASAALLVLGVRSGTRDDVRFKGGAPATFVLFVARGGGSARPLDPAETLRPGDVLRFGVVSVRDARAFVASIDESGRFTRYFPAAGDRGAPLDGREFLQVLPGSVVLDGTVGREWIVLVVSSSPIDERRVEEALRRAHRERRGGALGRVALDADVVVVPVTKVKP